MNVIIGLTTRVVIAENIPAESSGFYMSLWFFFATFGFIVGPILGTFIVTTYGYSYAFYTSSTIVHVATAYYGFYYQRDKEKQIAKKRNEISLLVSVKKLFTIPTLRTTYLITLLSVLETSGISSFLPIYASENIGMTTIAVGGVMTTAAVGRLLATPLVGRISDKINKRKLLAAIQGVAAVFFALFLIVQDSYQLTMVAVGVSLCFSTGVLSIAIHSSAVPKGLSGIALGLYGTFE